MECPNCRDEMAQVHAGEVTVDFCEDCAAFWFDMDEIRRFIEATDSDAAHIPTDECFKAHTTGLEETCTCCGHDNLERGVAGRAEFRRCTWCGGLFLFRVDLESYELDGKDEKTDDDVWLLFGVLREIATAVLRRMVRLP